MELKCPGCSARFRLTLTADIDPNERVPCPKCGTPIPVRPAQADQGWARRDHSKIFGRTPEATPASRAPTRKPRAERAGTPRRVFRDITTVEDASGRPPRAQPPGDWPPSGMPTGESPPTSPPSDAPKHPFEDRDPTLERPLPSAGILRREGIGAGANDDGSDEIPEPVARPKPERPFGPPAGQQLGRLRLPDSAASDESDDELAATDVMAIDPKTLDRVALAGELASESADDLVEPPPLGEADVEPAATDSETTERGAHAAREAGDEPAATDSKTTERGAHAGGEEDDEPAATDSETSERGAHAAGEADDEPLRVAASKATESEAPEPDAPVGKSDQPAPVQSSAKEKNEKLSTAELLKIAKRRLGSKGAVDLRVGERIFDNVSTDQLVEVLARGVVPETLYARAPDGSWTRLTDHAIYHEAARRLADRSEAVVEEVITGEVTRSPRFEVPSPPSKPREAVSKRPSANVANQRPAPAVDTPEPPAESPAASGAETPEPPAESPSSGAETPEPPAESPTPAIDTPEPAAETPAEPSPSAEPQDAAVAIDVSKDAIPADISAQLPALAGPRPRWPFVLVIVAVLASAVAAWMVAPIFRPPPPDPPPPKMPPPKDALRAGFHVVDVAKAFTNKQAKLRSRDTAAVIAEAQAHLDKSNFGDALGLAFELNRRAPDNARATEILARAHAGTGDYHAARTAIASLAARRELPPELRRLFRTTLQTDPSLPPPIRTLPTDERIDQIRALGGGKSLSFKLYRDDRKVYAFKPAQEEWDDGWRSEIAAYTLCEILPCGFEVPRSFTARIPRSDWEALYPLNGSKQIEYAAQFDRLQWRAESDRDGAESEVIYGVAKHWVPTFVDWPIEYVDVWRPWLDASAPDSILDRPIREELTPLREHGEHYAKVTSELDDSTTRDVARQLSNVMVFDFLINNWDRFSTREEYYGVNNQFVDGHFISIDNGAGFHTQISDRVTSRFQNVERFSKSMIAAVRLLDRELVDPLLFPNATQQERARLDVFWERRRQLLERVDELVALHGEEAVLAFE